MSKKKQKTKEEVLQATIDEAMQDPKYSSMVFLAHKQLEERGHIDDMLLKEIERYWDSKYGID